MLGDSSTLDRKRVGSGTPSQLVRIYLTFPENNHIFSNSTSHECPVPYKILNIHLSF